MRVKFRLFIPLVLICSLLLGSTCFASSGGRGWVYSDNSLNSETISKFNSMSRAEQSAYIKEIFPIFSRSLGFIPKNGDAYTLLNAYYTTQLGIKQRTYSSADDYASSDDDKRFYYVYRDNGEYYWFKDFSDLLTNSFSSFQGKLVMNDTTPFYFVSDSYINNIGADNGFFMTQLYSYKQINSTNFPNLTLYNAFIARCNEWKSAGHKFVMIAQQDKSYYYLTYFDGAFYNNGSTLGKTVAVINDKGTRLTFNNIACFRRWGDGSAFSSSNYGSYSYVTIPYCILGGPDIPSSNVGGWGNNTWSGTWNIYTLSDSPESYQMFTSLNGWIGANGHFEYPYELANYYGRVPTTTVNSNQVTQLYNNIYTDNSDNSINNTNTNIYYPSGYEPDSNSYDKDTHKLDFSGVGALLASIGDLIGSLINGFAQGFANIIESITSVARNIMEALSGGLIFEFLKSFLAWLPEPLPTMILALFTISVTFAVIRLVKGAFS